MPSRRLRIFSTPLIVCLAFVGLVSLGAGAEAQSPTATPTSSPTASPPDYSYLEQRIDKIAERVEVLEEPQALHLTVENPPKDLWDIVKVFSEFFSAVMVAAVAIAGAFAARAYDRRQLAVQKMQARRKPHNNAK